MVFIIDASCISLDREALLTEERMGSMSSYLLIVYWLLGDGVLTVWRCVTV